MRPQDYQRVHGDGRGQVVRAAPAVGSSRLRNNRGYDAAKMTRLTADWAITSYSADEEIRWTLRALRARSRQLAMNNDYFKAFLQRARQNIIGPEGVTLQVDAQEDGRRDERANDTIEAAWVKWCRRDTCTVDGRLSWLQCEHLAVTSAARDGEAIFRLVTGFANGFAFASQPLEADHLDETYNADLRDGREIRMGIERDTWGRAVAYHLWQRHPFDRAYGAAQQARIRVPAAEIVHLFVPDFLVQSRGVPWAHTAMSRLKMLGGYEEAALVAARVGAAKMGFYTQDPTSGPHITDGQKDTGQETDGNGNPISDAEAGHFEKLPPGLKFESWNPNYPDGEMPGFVKAMLRGVAAGLNVSYNTLANDLEGVNYSSIRAGLLDERDGWRVLQRWIISELHERVFAAWLAGALLSGAVNLPMAKFDKFNAPRFRPRGWPWVDPEKDLDAADKEVQLGVTSRTEVAARHGRDFRQVIDDRKAEEQYARAAGVDISGWAKSKPAVPKPGEAAAPPAKE